MQPKAAWHFLEIHCCTGCHDRCERSMLAADGRRQPAEEQLATGAWRAALDAVLPLLLWVPAERRSLRSVVPGAWRHVFLYGRLSAVTQVLGLLGAPWSTPRRPSMLAVQELPHVIDELAATEPAQAAAVAVTQAGFRRVGDITCCCPFAEVGLAG
jgi:hypothetical protein